MYNPILSVKCLSPSFKTHWKLLSRFKTGCPERSNVIINILDDGDDYLFEDLGLAPAGLTGRGPLQQTPVVDPNLVTQGVAGGGAGGTGNVLPSGLTAIEEAFLSRDEKAMRLKLLKTMLIKKRILSWLDMKPLNTVH